MEILEYIVQLRGAAAAGAQVRGLTGEMNKLAGAQARVGESSAAAGRHSAAFAGAMGVMTKVAKVTGAALIGVGIEAVKMSVSFNHEMLRIRTDAGASNKELAYMESHLVTLGKAGAFMGQSPNSVAAGLYHLESLGIRGSRALKALVLSSQEAAISGANLEQTTTAMGAAMYVGMKGTGNLTTLMGTLNATVGAGNMRFQDLVEALGTGVLPSAKVAGLSIQDVSAALAVATDSGYKASSAAAQLGTAFHFLYAPTSKATTALRSIGLTHNSLANDMHKPRGLLVALTDLKTHLSGLSDVAKAQVLNAILPGGRGRILLTELTMLDRLKGKYEQINKTAGGFTGSVAQQRKDPQTQLKTAEGDLSWSLIRLGNVLLPIVVPALTALLRVGTSVVRWLSDLRYWFQALPFPIRMMITVVGLMVGQAVLLWGLAKAWLAIKAAVALVKLAFGGLSPARLGIMALVAIAVLIVAHWKEVKAWVDHNKLAFIALVAVISPIAAAVATAFVIGKLQAFAGAITAIFPFIGTLLARIGLVAGATEAASVAGIASNARFGASFLALLGPIGLAAGAVGGLAAGANAIVHATGGTPNPTGSFNAGGGGGASGTSPGQTGGANILGVHVGGIGGGWLHSLGIGAAGAVVTRPTRALIGEKGPEALIPLSKMPGASPLGAGGGGGDIIVQIEGREVARVMRRQIMKAMAAGA